ncbi:MAG: ribulose-phosphate 3-epimerase [Clostridia bacterium]|nr:ribulose-phosphate 3-epimerase [Clostridia bacterium]
MIQIAPSLLAADILHMADEVRKVETAGSDLLHVDIMDGHFVPNLSFGPHLVAALKKITTLPLDVHLMLTNPLQYIDSFAQSGADIITVHAECQDDVETCFDKIRAHGLRCGIVLSPDTQPEAYFPLIDKADMTLVMSVYPGFGGQSFIPESLEKIKTIRSHTGADYQIEIDGGVSTQNIERIIAAGANVIVAGSGIFQSVDPRKTIEQMKQGRTG